MGIFSVIPPAMSMNQNQSFQSITTTINQSQYLNGASSSTNSASSANMAMIPIAGNVNYIATTTNNGNFLLPGALSSTTAVPQSALTPSFDYFTPNVMAAFQSPAAAAPIVASIAVPGAARRPGARPP